MFEMSGPELIEVICEYEDLSGILIVFLTAKSDEESKLAGKDIGVDFFLGKFFNV